MDEITRIKNNMKNKRNLKINNKPNNTTETKSPNKYINGLITRILISLIIFFGIIIFSNSSTKNKEFFSNNILNQNLPFNKIYNIYNKYFGNIIPVNFGNETNTVFNEKIVYDNAEEYLDGYKLTVSNNYLIPIIESGIVVFNGEKGGYGNTIIIQGIDEIDYWYSNVQNTNITLYDYVSKGDLLGTTNGSKLYLTFQKQGEFLGIDEILK